MKTSKTLTRKMIDAIGERMPTSVRPDTLNINPDASILYIIPNQNNASPLVAFLEIDSKEMADLTSLIATAQDQKIISQGYIFPINGGSSHAFRDFDWNFSLWSVSIRRPTKRKFTGNKYVYALCGIEGLHEATCFDFCQMTGAEADLVDVTVGKSESFSSFEVLPIYQLLSYGELVSSFTDRLDFWREFGTFACSTRSRRLENFVNVEEVKLPFPLSKAKLLDWPSDAVVPAVTDPSPCPVINSEPSPCFPGAGNSCTEPAKESKPVPGARWEIGQIRSLRSNLLEINSNRSITAPARTTLIVSSVYVVPTPGYIFPWDAKEERPRPYGDIVVKVQGNVEWRASVSALMDAYAGLLRNPGLEKIKSLDSLSDTLAKRIETLKDKSDDASIAELNQILAIMNETVSLASTMRTMPHVAFQPIGVSSGMTLSVSRVRVNSDGVDEPIDEEVRCVLNMIESVEIC